jgi:hypothetical protein
MPLERWPAPGLFQLLPDELMMVSTAAVKARAGIFEGRHHAHTSQ